MHQCLHVFILLKGLHFGHVGNMVIGTGKIIDRSTKIVQRKEPKAKDKKKSSTKGMLCEYCYTLIHSLGIAIFKINRIVHF